MSSNVPTVRQVAWISMIPQMLLMGLLIFIFSKLNTENPVFNGAFAYIVISIIIRQFLVGKYHKAGMRLVKQEKYLEAIPYFQQSYDFFKRNNWIDKYRFITMLSSSKICYKEMALNNIAFCYGQAGDGIKSKEWYERTLQEFPESGLAKSGLRLLTAISNQTSEK